MIQKGLLLLLSAFLFVGCIGKKQRARRTMDCSDPIVKLDQLKSTTDSIQRDFTFLKIRGDIDVAQKEKNIGFSAQIRMHKDVAVWVSLKKLGFPVLKMKFTQDSVFIVNTFEQSYFASTYEYAYSKIDANINFEIVQSALLSQVQWSDAYQELWHTPTQYVASSHRKRIMNAFQAGENKIDERAFTQWVNCNTLLLNQLNIYDPKEEANIWVWASEPDSSAGFWMNQKLKLEVNKSGENVLKMDIDLKDIEIRDDLSLPLNIPEGYEEMQF